MITAPRAVIDIVLEVVREVEERKNCHD